jgi:NADH:ubiquinone oxidoreductase subunit F (NADH-binding)
MVASIPHLLMLNLSLIYVFTCFSEGMLYMVFEFMSGTGCIIGTNTAVVTDKTTDVVEDILMMRMM